MGYRVEDLHKVNERDSHKTFAMQLQHTSVSVSGFSSDAAQANCLSTTSPFCRVCSFTSSAAHDSHDLTWNAQHGQGPVVPFVLFVCFIVRSVDPCCFPLIWCMSLQPTCTRF